MRQQLQGNREEIVEGKEESIFTSLRRTSAELEKAKEQVKEQFETSTSLSAENALLRQQLQGNHEEIVGGNSDASMTPLASDGSLMAPMASDGSSSSELMGADSD